MLDGCTYMNSVILTSEIEPQVESRIRDNGDLEPHLSQAANNIISLLSKVGLQSFHLFQYRIWLQHRNRSLLEWDVCTTIQVTSTRSNSLDKFFWSHDPRYSSIRRYLKSTQRMQDIPILHPGSLKRFVSPSMSSTSSSSTSTTFSAALTVVPSQSEV